MGLKPPRHSRHRALYTYRDPLTAKLEHMAVTQTLDRLRGTELGALFYEQSSRRVKPKHILRALQRSPFADVAQMLSPRLVAPMTGEEAEGRLIGASPPPRMINMGRNCKIGA